MSDVIITVTCDWDGLDYYMGKKHRGKDLNPKQDPNFRFKKGIEAIAAFNKKFPNIPITHFICPAYFQRGTSLTNLYSKEITQKALKSSDEIALHIHCWISTVSCTNYLDPVRDLKVPDWGRNTGDSLGMYVPYYNSGKAVIDYGHGVPFGKYAPNQIKHIIDQANKILSIYLGKKAVSFRCGGWMTCDKVFDALIDQGFTHEASAVPGSYFPAHSKALKRTPSILDTWLSKLWSNTTATEDYLKNIQFLNVYGKKMPTVNTLNQHQDIIKYFQPKKIKQSTSTKTITEVPDTGLLADYVTPKWMKEHIDNAITLSQSKDIYISLGFHLESGGDPRFGTKFGLIERLEKVLDYFAKKATTIKYKTISQVNI